jgi:RNase H-fold protein (predicted Holliday junction resolvase)
MEVKVNANTLVFGFFDGVEVSFTVSNCERKNGNIKVNNIKNIDDDKSNRIPKTVNLADKRLKTSIAKPVIRQYFNFRNNHRALDAAAAMTATETMTKAKKKKKTIPNLRRSNYRGCFSRN